MRLRSLVWVALAVIAFVVPARESAAHARLRAASPPDSAQLDRSPTEIKLSFTEPIEPSLSSITVRDRGSSRLQMVHTLPVPGDPRSCVAPVTPLEPGSYVVDWRVVSADGHAVTGSYTFAIRALQVEPPASVTYAPAAAAPPTPPVRASRREMLARWLFMVGVAALVGAAAASAAAFGGEGTIALAAIGCGIALLGVLLLGDAQRRIAGTSAADLLKTAIGHALIWRAAAIAAAGVAVAAARVSRRRRPAMVFAFIFALASIAVHASAGHAAAVDRYQTAAVWLQSLHFAAGGIWIGGLAALLMGARGEPAAAKTDAVRRYSSIAAIALVVVAATGILRTVQELSSWNQLVASDYGQAALAKGLLLVAIAAVGALNRWRSVPAASTDLRPLRRFALVELALMIVVLGVAAILATLPPPE